MGILAELAPREGSTKTARRIGRGHGSGWGKTAAKGHKGQKARSGVSIKAGFEGGQTPLYRRLPKFGFTNAAFKKHYTILTLDQLNKMGGEITPESLAEKGLLKEKLVKVLANGTISESVKVKAHKVSKAAKAAIEAAGGSVEVI